MKASFVSSSGSGHVDGWREPKDHILRLCLNNPRPLLLLASLGVNPQSGRKQGELALGNLLACLSGLAQLDLDMQAIHVLSVLLREFPEPA